MDNRLNFLSNFLTELDAQGIWHIILRNHEDIYFGKEKDIDMLCSPLDFQLVHTIFNKICSENGHICTWNVSGKAMSLATNPGTFDTNFKDFPRELSIDMVSFVSVRDSFLKLKIPGYSLKFRTYQIQRERLVFDSFKCWAPSPDWLILFLLEKMQYKRKVVYKEKILFLLDVANSKIGSNSNLRSIIEKSLEEESTTDERLVVVQKALEQISYGRRFLTIYKEWLWLGKHNFSALVKRKGLIITFSGPDGAGKSTTKSNLIDFLQDSIELSVNSIRGFNRLNEPKNMGSVLKKIQHSARGVNGKTSEELENNYRDRKPKKGRSFFWKFRRLVGLLFIIVQYPFFYFTARVRTYFGVTTVVDTSVFDRFVKAHRPRFKFLERIVCPLLPSGDLTFRLYASPEVINKRKPELTLDELEEYYKAMDFIFSLKDESKIKTIETHLGVSVASQRVNEHVMLELGFCKINIGAFKNAN